MKERVTFTIESDILKRLDSTIDGFKVKNRSHAAELMLMRAMNANSINTAFVLAGGIGSRMKPITDEIPKPLIPLQGKPILQHTFELLKKYGIDNIIVSVGYKAEKIKEYFGDGAKFGLKIKYVEEKMPLGTAGPLKLARKYLRNTFILCNADELKNIDLYDMYLFHREQNAMGTIALTTVSDPSAYGVAKLQGSRILEFLEKPKNPPTNLINSGLYILEPGVIDMIPEGFAMMEKDVFPKIAKMDKLYGYSFSGQWFDTGSMERYATALKEWKGI